MSADVFLTRKMAAGTVTSRRLSWFLPAFSCQDECRTSLQLRFFFVLSVILGTLHGAVADGKTLVLLDNLNIKDTHSIFFRSLTGMCKNICRFESLCHYTTEMPICS